MEEQKFKKLVYGEEKGCSAFLFRLFMRGLALFFSPAIRVRNRLYDLGWQKIKHFPLPVVSVGNLTLGGTGKTPMTAWLIRTYREQGHHPAVLSRGYKAANYMGTDKAENRFRRLNDEAAELALEFPDLPHFLSPNRILAGKELLKEYPETDLIILDDGFQYRRLYRNINILLLDALDPFGGKRIFPAGFLREPLASLRRADIVLLTRADLVSESRRSEIERTFRKFAPQAKWGETRQIPTALIRYREEGWEQFPFSKLQTLSAADWLPFCGLGNPNGFYQMLKKAGISIKGEVSFPDHTSPGKAEIEQLASAAAEIGCGGFLTTMKDLVKLRRSEIGGKPLWGVKIGLDFLKGKEIFYKGAGLK